jgi:glutathione-regulated potassium-efflux system ancillary protein KefG
MKTLVLFAHPAVQHSRSNGPMLAQAQQTDGVTVVDLYAEYPRFDIDVATEQRRLLDHDAIVFQFPLLWYSAPPLLKQWYDLVLQHGFAYGEHGIALKGKLWMCAVTVGGPLAAYGPEGRHGYSLRHLLSPIEATANLCQMPFLAPYVLFGSLGATDETRTTHAGGYRRLLETLRDDRLDLESLRPLSTISATDVPALHTGEVAS